MWVEEGRTATPGIVAQTKQIVLKEIRARWGEFPELVTQLVAKITALSGSARCRLMKGRHIPRQLSEHEWVAAAWVASVLILLRAGDLDNWPFLTRPRAQLSATEAVPSREQMWSPTGTARRVHSRKSVAKLDDHAERTAAPRSKITATSTVIPR
jgi:hypothetical protein